MVGSNFNHFPEVAQALHDEIVDIVKTTAQGTVQIAQSRAPVDTGFLKSSIYYSTLSESSYGQEAGAPPEGAYLLPEMDKPADETSATIGVAASYGEYVEMGTRYQPAQPYLQPAIDAMAGPFQDALSFIEEGIKARLNGI